MVIYRVIASILTHTHSNYWKIMKDFIKFNIFGGNNAMDPPAHFEYSPSC